MSVIADMGEPLEEIYPLAEDPNVREILDLSTEAFDLFMTFFTGGAVSMLTVGRRCSRSTAPVSGGFPTRGTGPPPIGRGERVDPRVKHRVISIY